VAASDRLAVIRTPMIIIRTGADGAIMNLEKVILLVALAFALVAGMVSIPYAAAITAVFGAVAGFAIRDDEAVTFLVAALALGLAHGALAPIPTIGLFLTDILESVSALFNAAACTVVVRLAFASLVPDSEATD